MTKLFIESLLDELLKLNEETSLVYDWFAEDLKKDLENSYEDIDALVSDFRDFLIKNDAELPEG